MAVRKIKDPQAILDYPIDWTLWLDGDTISDSTWTVPPGLTLDHHVFNGQVAIVWLAGGLPGERHLVTNHITTAAGRQDERSILVEIQNK